MKEKEDSEEMEISLVALRTGESNNIIFGHSPVREASNDMKMEEGGEKSNSWQWLKERKAICSGENEGDTPQINIYF